MALDLQILLIARAPPASRMLAASCELFGEAILMTRMTIQEDRWRTLFQEQRTALAVTAEMLSYRKVPTKQILSNALTELEGHPFHEGFASTFALRAAVKAALALNTEATDSPIEMTLPDLVENGRLGGISIGSLPWPERAVFFLRKVLGYSRRDTALLLGMTDANVDQLYNIAEKRIGSSRYPFILSLEILVNAHGRPSRSMAFASNE
jgi:hypothetical protein